jgi:hypothetical protein
LPRSLYSLLRYWHLLSLDAPTVAALWCWAFGRAAHLGLAWWLPLALALGTWLFYVADRLLDARTAPPAELQQRHRFHHRHRRLFLAASLPVGLALAMMVAHMPRTLLLAYAVLGALALLYLAAVHLARWSRGWLSGWLSKELAVALLFAAATALPAWQQARRVAADPLLLYLLFAGLCWLDCRAIEDWEHAAARGRVAVAAALVAGCACLCLLALHSNAARELALCAGLSAVLLLALNASQLDAGARRIAADLMLMTPLLLLLPR